MPAYNSPSNGRMQRNDIANFPSTFYFILKPCARPVNGNKKHGDWIVQTTAICLSDVWHRSVWQCFPPKKLFRFTPSDKINETEADIVVRLVQSINRIYEANGKTSSSEMLGIIAPYRNQIATLIKHKTGFGRYKRLRKIMVDTVERFPGKSARSDFTVVLRQPALSTRLDVQPESRVARSIANSTWLSHGHGSNSL